MSSRWAFRLVACCGLTILAHPWCVAAAPATVLPATHKKPAGEEIIVTAQRRAQNAQKVPISITALGARALQARSIRGAADLAAAAPNVQYTDDGSGEPAAINIRGIGAYTKESGIDQAVSVYVDDVYIAGNDAISALNLYDVDHAEILRGPQGTLFGRNALAGAINITTKMPTATTSADLRVTYGDYNLRQVTGIFNASLAGDKLFLNLAATGIKHSGYVDDLTTHSGVDAENQFGGRLKLLARPADDLEILFTGEHQRNDAPSGAGPIAFYNKSPLLPVPGFLAPFFGTDPRIIAADPQPNANNLSTEENPAPAEHFLEDTASVRATLQTGLGTFTSISAFRHDDYRWIFSGGGAPVPFAVAAEQNADQSWSQELRWAKQFDPYIDLIGGLYFYGERSDNTPHISVEPAYAQVFQNALSHIEAAFGPGLGGLIDRAIEAGFPVQAGSAQANAVTDVESYAGYLHAIGHISPVVDVTLGARYTYEQRSIDFSQSSNPFLRAAEYQVIAPEHGSVAADNFSPLFTLTYRPQPLLLGYFTFSEGFKGGGYNNYYATGSTPAAAAQGIVTPFMPETLTNYEIGTKASLFDRRLVIDADAFYMNWHNRQLLEQVAESSGSNFETVNCCDLDVLGAEFEATARPFDALQLRAAYGTNYPKVTKSIDPAATGIHSGDILDVSPRYNCNAGMDLNLPLNDRKAATVTADYYYHGHWALNETNPRVVQGAFGLLDARLAVGPRSGAWSVQIWGKNLTDTRWVAAGLITGYAFPFIGTFQEQPAPPRTFGVDFVAHL